jgi:phytoene desaturase
MKHRVVIIGGGVGGLAVACLLAKAGRQVTVLEKNEQLGGRASLLGVGGFRFDTGPSWLLMRGVFEHFFALLDEPLENHLQLTKLTPSYRVFDAASGQQLDILSDLVRDAATFASVEPGADARLRQYLAQVAATNNLTLSRFLYTTFASKRELLIPKLIRSQLLTSMHREAASFFADPLLQKTISYPAIFLGTSPYRAPALYGLLNHYLFNEGVWYPKGGMYSLVEALVRIGRRQGVVHRTNVAVTKINSTDGRANGVSTQHEQFPADIVISNAGKYHTETSLLGPEQRDHSPKYWQRRSWSPSALLLYLGVNRQYDSLAHHNLLFSKNWRRNLTDIFKSSDFPQDPSLYICAPSKTDATVAPKGYENLFVLAPVSAGLQYTQHQLETFAESVLATLETQMSLPNLRQHILYKRMFCVHDFAERFNSFKGTSLGLQHTLRQSALFRPSNTGKKVQGLYFVGADAHPGVGLPPVLISAELLYKQLIDEPI